METVPVPTVTPPSVSRPPERRSFMRRHRIVLLIVVGTVAVAGGFLAWRATRQGAVAYETVAVRRGDLRQTVTATGAVKSASEFNLDFQAAGRVASTTVEKGDAVTAGTVLATLEGTEYTLAAERAQAALAEARANLNKAVAGAAPQEVRVKEAALAEADARVGQASTTLSNTIRRTALDVAAADLSVRKAASDRDRAEQALADDGRAKDQAVEKALGTELADAHAAAVALATAVTDMDNLLGVDNASANDAFEGVLAAQDPATLLAAKDAYRKARDAKQALDRTLAGIAAAPGAAATAAAAEEARGALTAALTALGKVRTVLDATAPSSQLTLAELNTRKTTIDTDRTTVNTKYATLIADASATALAVIDRDATLHADRSALDAAEIALAQARQARDVAVLAADTEEASDAAALAVAEAQRDQAQANLDLLTATLRDVDRAPFEAAVAQAKAAAESAEADLAKTRIVAPTDGIVTDVAVNVGELASEKATAITMLSAHYEVEADIPETDVAKIRVGQAAAIVFDALGPDTRFPGVVLSVNPAETVIQDIVYYKMRVAIERDGDQVKPGMTANITVDANRKDGVLLVPLRAIRDDRDRRYVDVLAGGRLERRDVTLGIRGDEGLVEVVSGLAEGDEAVIGVQSAR